MKKLQLRFSISILTVLSVAIFASCNMPAEKTAEKTEESVSETEEFIAAVDTLDPPEGVDDEDTSYHGGEIIVINPAHDTVPEKVVCIESGRVSGRCFSLIA